MITIEVDQALEELKKGFSNVTQAKVNEVTAKALNAAMRTARTHAYDEIRKVYNVSDIAVVTSKLRGRNARPGDLNARLFADRLGIQLRNFAPASSRGDRKSYLSIEVIRGRRQTIKSAFWADVRKGAGNELGGIFARGGYKGREFQFRRKRVVPYPQPDMPIGLIRTTSPFSMLGNAQVQYRIERAAGEHFEKVFKREMDRIINAPGNL